MFNIYVDEILIKWKLRIDSEIKLSNKEYINTLLFADDHLVVQETEDQLQ